MITTNVISQVSNSGYIFYELSEYQQLAVENADNDRQTVIGVSSDEELQNMIKYQSAYNASSRFINVINEMLEHLVTRL